MCTFCGNSLCGNILVAVHTSRKIGPSGHRRSPSATPSLKSMLFFSSYPVNVPGTEDQQLAEVTKGGQTSLNESVPSATPLSCACQFASLLMATAKL